MKRILIAGESGGGIVSTGEIVARALKNLGYWVVTEREFPSLIQGGHASYSVSFADEPLYGLSQRCDILLSLSKIGLQSFLPRLIDGGYLVHGYERLSGIQPELAECERRRIQVVHVRSREKAMELGGTELVKNMILLGMLWKTLGLPLPALESEITQQFGSKPALLAVDLTCAQWGYSAVQQQKSLLPPTQNPPLSLLTGNHAIALGAIQAGVRLYAAYPMSPSTGILKHLAEYADAYNLIVKQAEDEITAVSLVLGANYAGTRALTATSGGGFDLMTETLSLAMITETPLVIVLCQRPGPATGLPTWTAQSDVHLALYAGHGEGARVVLSVSDPADSFTLIQTALNISEQAQVPVILLSEKQICEHLYTVETSSLEAFPIERNLTAEPPVAAEKPTHGLRYQLTESGISPRWVPTKAPSVFCANSDEHTPDGTLTEDASVASSMYKKRIQKLNHIRDHLIPPPEYIGPPEPNIAFIGFGSNKNIMQDVISLMSIKGVQVGYLHFPCLSPLDTKAISTLQEQCKGRIHLIEGNATGQFGQLIEQHCGPLFRGKLLKWDGRPFYQEEVIEYIEHYINS
ncbi:2-oxoacid:acceptor oxidoreductase subunit alpha [Candidatus Peribacteria bacterium]|nr:2-oxoacid:acceptor oxidoreductase subunit alpha [Candidatus Peribacteria bacterium]